jgi:hypothetical protein
MIITSVVVIPVRNAREYLSEEFGMSKEDIDALLFGSPAAILIEPDIS